MILLIDLIVCSNSIHPANNIITTKDKYIWRNLTEFELKSWYTPTELCMLEVTPRIRPFPQGFFFILTTTIESHINSVVLY